MNSSEHHRVTKLISPKQKIENMWLSLRPIRASVGHRTTENLLFCSLCVRKGAKKIVGVMTLLSIKKKKKINQKWINSLKAAPPTGKDAPGSTCYIFVFFF